jgi:hypothetical protein
MNATCAKLARYKMVERACSGCMAEVDAWLKFCCNAVRKSRATSFIDLVEGKGESQRPLSYY